MTGPKVVSTNLAGFIEAPTMGPTPYRVDRDGRPFLPLGDGGIVRGLGVGDSVFGTDTDHAAPGACLTHPQPDALHALTSFACLGNTVGVRSGRASGANGTVLGKRGEQGRVIVCFPDDVLAQLAPGDAVVVRCHGQGATLPPTSAAKGTVQLMNASPSVLSLLPLEFSSDHVVAGVRAVVPSFLAGNGIGRPAHQWDIDIQVHESTATRFALQDLRLGDLLGVSDLDVRHNAGHRRGWTTIGIVVHGGSPQPGHGPGVMPILCGPAQSFTLQQAPEAHQGITLEALVERAENEDM